jgi:hypothetical protein
MKKYATATLETFEAVRADHGLLKDAHRAEFSYTPREGFIYVRSRAISSRCNDNYDDFPASEIKTAYRTFVGKPVFVNHHNDDHTKARGVIIDAHLHEDRNLDGSPDTWVEVLMEVHAARFPKLAEAILADPPAIDRTSMGCDVEYSLCSLCGNRAETPLEYCAHIPALKGQKVSKGGESVLVREVCYGLGFFENSLLVEEPADPTALFLGVETGPGVMAKAASKRALIHDEDVRVPPQVDTLQDNECPVCGEEDSFTNDRCLVCGYERPPDFLQDPDLDKAKERDQLQDDKGGGEESPFVEDAPAAGEATPDQGAGVFVEDDAQPVEGTPFEEAPMTAPPAAGADQPVEQLAPGEPAPPPQAPGQPVTTNPAQPPEQAQQPPAAPPTDEEQQPEEGEEQEDEDDKSKPPWLKGKPKDKKAALTEEKEMREALEALAEARGEVEELRGTVEAQAGVINTQREFIGAQARRITESNRRTGTLEKVVGEVLKSAPKGLRQKCATIIQADQKNPANPVPEPGGQGPEQTTEDALAGDSNNPVKRDQPAGGNATDLQTPGGVPGSTEHVPADATDTVDSVGTSLDTPAFNEDQDVTQPVSGTTEQRPLSETKTEVDVRTRQGDDSPAFPITPDGGFAEQQKTTGSKRAMASLRLARARIFAGIADGVQPGEDADLAYAASIEASDLTDTDIASEIAVLDKVKQGAMQRGPQQDTRHLVPRSAARDVPSLVSRESQLAHGTPMLVGAPTDEEFFGE